jgi:hypothetical protein
MTVHFESEAFEEYREAAQYSEDRFGLGLQFVAAMQAALKEIGRDPARSSRWVMECVSTG